MPDTKICQTCGKEKPVLQFIFHGISRDECLACLAPDHAPRIAIYSGPTISRKKALVNGLSHYFTNAPCLNGHIDQRETATRLCLECIALGLVAKSRVRDRTKANARRLAERHANLDVARAQSREYAALHAEENAAKQRQYRVDQPDRVKATQKRGRIKNLPKILVRNRARRALKKAAVGSHTASDIADIRRMQKDTCAIPGCRVKLNGKGHVDHRVPLSKGGTNDRRNIQILCPKHNMQKSAKDEIDFMQSLGLLL